MESSSCHFLQGLSPHRSKQVIKIKLFRNKSRGIIDLGFAKGKKENLFVGSMKVILSNLE
jgi:hypothetical protein